ncbi:hypothetical protein [Rhodoferax saidenbachensis]|uniref:Integrase n=1 Tax=Rhodoferax saidenbachensis TaxID=1484693 RepID=A0A1P8KA84_9BURK|nr:hypothetical protein [Rhodoferax saidenbachensis]APW42892.1 hypothetical protein RS694_10335 [Rhodoferax saidenbachensis]
MNENFKTLIENARTLAADKGLSWHIPLDEKGIALKGHSWNLRHLSKDGKPTTYVLRKFSEFEDAQAELVARGVLDQSELGQRPVSAHWQDLIKAFVLDHVVVRSKSLAFAQAASMAWRFLASIARKEPWLVTVEDVRLACEVSDICQNTDARTINIMALIRNYVDAQHLFDACPLTTLVDRPQIGKNAKAKFAKTSAALSQELAQRKTQEKLPERRAFWQLMSIVYTERPKSIVDYLRFALVKLMVLTGLRIGEVVYIPFDWRRTRGYRDQNGRPAGESGGISETLMIRHFAEKQEEPYFFEETQFVPDIFRAEVESILEGVARITAPLRTTLRAQYESGRIFPQYETDELVDAVVMYVHLTGNPIWVSPPYSHEITQCIERYRATYDPAELAKFADLQRTASHLAAAVSRYFSPENRSKGLVLRDKYGLASTDKGVRGKFLLVSDVEDFVKRHVPTKRPDLSPLRLNQGGSLAPWEMMFLMPKRAVGEGRGQSVIDIVSTFSVGLADQALLVTALGGVPSDQKYSLFNAYGNKEEDRLLTLTTHTFRHLQTTELFRLGVADSIISKRFNRRSVAQSYVYDHRSLAEELDAIELPAEWSSLLGDGKAATVGKMIAAGKANGPIVREFKRIQVEEGDQAALQFLMAEADGFHATPYGTCLNAFTVDPCPTSLECFNDCRHLSATGLPEHQKNLVVLRGRLQAVLENAQAKPEGTIGKANQISHAMKRLQGVEKLLATPAGALVFPEGVDLSKPNRPGTVLDGT